MKDPSKVFYSVLVSFIAGIAFSSFLNFYWSLWLLGILTFIILLAVIKKQNKIFVIALLAIFFILGGFRLQAKRNVSSQNISNLNGQEIELSATVCGEVIQDFSYQKAEICADGYSGKILVYLSNRQVLNFADKLKVNCLLQAPQNFADFAYDRYLALRDIYSICRFPEFKLVELGRGNYKYNLRKIIAQKLDKNLNSKNSAIAKALVLADKNSINSELRTTFSKAGLSHILAISGLHIGIIIAGLWWLLWRLGLSRPQITWAIFIILVVYLSLIGFPASAVRASLMGWLLLLAYSLGRLNSSFKTLILAATIMLLYNPLLLRDDLGFQLSFLAVAGILIFLPTWPQPKKIYLKIIVNLVYLSIASQILSWPLIANSFGVISLVGPLANLFLLWLLPIILLSLFFALIIGFIVPSLQFVLFFPVALFLSVFSKSAEFFSALPLSSIEFNYNIPFWFLLFYYLSLFLIIKKEAVIKTTSLIFKKIKN